MMQIRRRAPSLLAAIICVWGGIELSGSLSRDDFAQAVERSKRNQTQAAPQAPKQPKEVFEIAPKKSLDLQSLSARSLFSPNRKLVATPEVIAPRPLPVEGNSMTSAPVVAEASSPRLSYRGFLATGTKLKALIVLAETQQEAWVSFGDLIEGWEIIRVSPIAIELQRNGERHIVEFNQ